MIHYLVKLTPLILFIKEVKTLFPKREQKISQITNDNFTFNEYHKRVIHAEYAAAKLHNKVNPNKITNQALADRLNQKFNCNKSVRAYSRIWSKERKHERD